jgi:membrane-bound ClpP family serine protease
LPSAGILTFFSVAALLGSILLGFRAGPVVGLTMTATVIVGVPTVISLGFRWWPYTRVGKQVLLEAPKAEDVLPDESLRRQLKDLIGRLGRAKCRMLPSGVVTIDGRTLDAMSESSAIEAGQTVRVIKVESNWLVVRAVDEEVPNPESDNPLERPIDSVASDPFGEPLV